MIPKDKANNLINRMVKFQTYTIGFEVDAQSGFLRVQRAKQCALIAVKEIIKDRERLKDALFYDLNYWLEVKQEIEKL